LSELLPKTAFSLSSLARGTNIGGGILTSLLSRSNRDVHLCDLRHENILCDVPLHLEGAGEDTVLGGEELVRQHELSRLLERAQLVTNSEIRQLGTDDFLELSGLAQLLE